MVEDAENATEGGVQEAVVKKEMEERGNGDLGELRSGFARSV